MTVLLVTVLNGTGQFAFFTYLTPSLKASLSADARTHDDHFGWYGAVATFGNVVVTRAVRRIGAPRSALVYISRHVGGYGCLGHRCDVAMGRAGGGDDLGSWNVCRKFRSAGAACRYCSRPDVGVNRAQHVGDLFRPGSRRRYRRRADLS